MTGAVSGLVGGGVEAAKRICHVFDEPALARTKTARSGLGSRVKVNACAAMDSDAHANNARRIRYSIYQFAPRAAMGQP